jgi:hypothetical protein
MAHAFCIQDTESYKHTNRVCNFYNYFTATIVDQRVKILRYNYVAYLVCPSFAYYDKHGSSLIALV